ncbi:MAG: hypothetical protein GX171_02610 [Clostridiales bacterium]|jgi:hypothetical protein|nr:hypothetical protein [Clostridiales bacterium]
MENTNIPAPILQLRQDDVVAIPLERYEELIEFETRLGMLRKMRFIEVVQNNSTYIQSGDFVLGGMVLEALLSNQDKAKQPQEAADG